MKTPPDWLLKGYIILFACLPWSVETDFGSWNMMLPAELLLLGLGLGLIFLFWQSPRLFFSTFLEQPILQISFLLLAWLAISACFSSIPLVSWKYWVVAAGHWWVFAMGLFVWPSLWQRAFPWLVLSCSGLAVYVLAHHGYHHFRADQALLAPMPFFPEHTLWAANLVMMLFLIGIPKSAEMALELRGKRLFKGSHALAWSVLLIALVFSNCRAAWISILMAGFGALLLLLIGTKRWVLLLGLMLTGLLALKTIQSKATDVSSMERLNRWSCAYRMSLEKPWLGFGPGVFQFQYFRFQKPEEMTRISLQQPILERGPDNFGRGGGAHAAFFQAMSETGWPGFLLYAWFVLAVLWQGGKGLLQGASKASIVDFRGDKLLFWLALITFFSHGMVNDLWEDARIAALVWGSIAGLFGDSGAVNAQQTFFVKSAEKQL